MTDINVTIAETPITVVIDGGVDFPVAIGKGGTGATTASEALSNLGVDLIATKKSKLNATQAPTISDDSSQGFAVGSIWLDTTNSKVYQCKDAMVDSAVWIDLTGGGSGGASASEDIELGEDLSAGEVVKRGEDGKTYKCIRTEEYAEGTPLKLGTSSSTQYDNWAHYHEGLERVLALGKSSKAKAWWVSFDESGETTSLQEEQQSTDDSRSVWGAYNKKMDMYYWVTSYNGGNIRMSYGTPSASSIAWNHSTIPYTVALNNRVRCFMDEERQILYVLFADSTNSNYITVLPCRINQTTGEILSYGTKVSTGTGGSYFIAWKLKDASDTVDDSTGENTRSMWMMILGTSVLPFIEWDKEVYISGTLQGFTGYASYMRTAWHEKHQTSITVQTYNSNRHYLIRATLMGMADWNKTQVIDDGTQYGMNVHTSYHMHNYTYTNCPIYIPETGRMYLISSGSTNNFQISEIVFERSGTLNTTRNFWKHAGSPDLQYGYVVWHKTLKRLVILGRDSYLKICSYKIPIPQGEIRESIGILQVSGTAGQTRTVTLWGGEDQSMSGLNVGAWYGIDDNTGIVAERKGLPIGIATSATKLKTHLPTINTYH